MTAASIDKLPALAVMYRTHVAAQMLQGFTDGIEGDRLTALMDWALTGKRPADPDQMAALMGVFAAPWIAAREDGGWKGAPAAQAEIDLKRENAVAGLLTAFDAGAHHEAMAAVAAERLRQVRAGGVSVTKHTAAFDTSGAVYHRSGAIAGSARTVTVWSDLSPFTQGYIEALLREILWDDGHVVRDAAFSDLAPETLARIIADCEAAATVRGSDGYEATGREFWMVRQAGMIVAFPPLTVQLGDDGKVRFAKATGAGS